VALTANVRVIALNLTAARAAALINVSAQIASVALTANVRVTAPKLLAAQVVALLPS